MATVKEVLRRVYHELVRRRSRVRMHAPETVELTAPPIFLVGVYGSGTTLLRYVVDSHSRIACPPESEFLAALRPLLGERPLAGLAGMGFGEEHAVAKVRELALYFFGSYAASWGKPRWADKTPAYVDHLDFLHRLFPEARFAHLHRHGLDQAHSFTRGGTLERPELAAHARVGEDPRLASVRYWRAKSERILDFEARHPDACHRLGYEELCRDPEATLRLLFTFLDEPWEPGVLRFWEHPHDKGHEHGRVVATRGFQPRSGHHRRWPADLRRAALDVAAPVLRRLGYPVEEGR
jgi:hypothetical protein